MIKSEDKPSYWLVPPPHQKLDDDEIIASALDILRDRLSNPMRDTFPDPISSPRTSVEYLSLLLLPREREIFAVMLLDNRHRMLAYEELFQGTIDGASVHPREVVKAALRNNAAAVVLAHNHPSGAVTPSEADKRITRRLKEALALVDVRVLDHFIIGAEGYTSFAESGLM